MALNLGNLLRDPAFGVPPQPWLSTTQFSIALVFRESRPDWCGHPCPFEASLPNGRLVAGTVALDESQGRIRFHSLPASITPQFLVLGNGAVPQDDTVRVEAQTQDPGGNVQRFDLQRIPPDSWGFAPLVQDQRAMLKDAGVCWLVELDELPSAAQRPT